MRFDLIREKPWVYTTVVLLYVHVRMILYTSIYEYVVQSTASSRKGGPSSSSKHTHARMTAAAAVSPPVRNCPLIEPRVPSQVYGRGLRSWHSRATARSVLDDDSGHVRQQKYIPIRTYISGNEITVIDTNGIQEFLVPTLRSIGGDSCIGVIEMSNLDDHVAHSY